MPLAKVFSKLKKRLTTSADHINPNKSVESNGDLTASGGSSSSRGGAVSTPVGGESGIESDSDNTDIVKSATKTTKDFHAAGDAVDSHTTTTTSGSEAKPKTGEVKKSCLKTSARADIPAESGKELQSTENTTATGAHANGSATKDGKKKVHIAEESSVDSYMKKMYGEQRHLIVKSHPISEDYDVSATVLGLGINGKVVECFSKQTKEKFALKASICFRT